MPALYNSAFISLTAEEKRMLCKTFIRTFPSTEECELFESILQTRWSVLIEEVPGVTFDTYRNKQTPNISTLIWQFPDAETQKKIEKLIDENIKKFTATLSPKTMSFSGNRMLYFKT